MLKNTKCCYGRSLCTALLVSCHLAWWIAALLWDGDSERWTHTSVLSLDPFGRVYPQYLQEASVDFAKHLVAVVVRVDLVVQHGTWSRVLESDRIASGRWRAESNDVRSYCESDQSQQSSYRMNYLASTRGCSFHPFADFGCGEKAVESHDLVG